MKNNLWQYRLLKTMNWHLKQVTFIKSVFRIHFIFMRIPWIHPHWNLTWRDYEVCINFLSVNNKGNNYSLSTLWFIFQNLNLGSKNVTGPKHCIKILKCFVWANLLFNFAIIFGGLQGYNFWIIFNIPGPKILLSQFIYLWVKIIFMENIF